ncbi:MAG: hypothetical protein ACXU9U_03460, partial [Parachlamydiaceae bacterium]
TSHHILPDASCLSAFRFIRDSPVISFHDIHFSFSHPISHYSLYAYATKPLEADPKNYSLF